MRLYNTLTRSVENFAPSRDNTVRMYACGLTVYARGHIGNFRTFVCLDVLRRTLRHVAGHAMQQVVNFTDVDDKTIAGRPVCRYARTRGATSMRSEKTPRPWGSNRSRNRRARPTRRTCRRWPT